MVFAIMTMGAKGQKHGSAKSRSLEREGWVTVGGNQLTEAITLTVVVLTDAMGSDRRRQALSQKQLSSSIKYIRGKIKDL